MTAPLGELKTEGLNLFFQKNKGLLWCEKKNSLIILFILSLSPLSCSNEEEILAKKEKTAKKLLKKADHLLSIGKKFDAFKQYEKLAKEFPETEAKKIAEDTLIKKGLSLGSLLVSWTSQRMFELESRVVDYRNQKGNYPEGQAIKLPKDAWGNQVYFRLFPDKKIYDFIVFSRGPDKKKGTDDDLLVVHTRDENEAVTQRNQASGNASISLDQLISLENNEDAGASAEPSISLNQLLDMAEKKDSSSSSEEMELSLDELRNFSDNK